MCLRMCMHTLNVFDGAKYFISISISLSLQLSVKCCVTKVHYTRIAIA